ncbi:MAG: immunoglobulin domain-containing protein [Candidatus Didemnitutus sp.]|nr:immunoglobulin domain-containing protein [Candidatus Didemnitutus sp.]
MSSLALAWFVRFRRVQLPMLTLIAFLQRTPVLRLLLGAPSAWLSGSAGQVLRSTVLVGVAAGAVDTLAGATTFTASPASPASATAGTPFNAAFAVTGAPSAVKSYTISNLPPGLTVTGATASGSNLLLNASTGTISGTPTTAGNYSATITAWEKTGGTGNSKGYSYTIAVTGSAATAPSITTQPSGQTVTAGASASFSVTASGTAPLSYQWRKDGTDIGGATASTYAISTTAMTDAGTYTVVVSNSAGSVTSSGATLTVNAAAIAPSITTQPVAQTVNTGASVSFSVTASGTAPLSYQWRKDGANIASATSATYTIGSAATTDAGTYSVVVSNSVGSATSNGAALTVNVTNTATAPSITTQPAAQTVNTGVSVSFSVTASGTAPLSYQWRKDGANIGSATSATYTIGSAATTDAAAYTVVVTNSAGSVTSNPATLTVNVATTAIFPHLAALAIDGSGRLYAVDSTNATVSRIAADGSVYLVAGSSGSTGTADGTGSAARFNQPGGLAATNAGVLYVADTANALIRRISAEGVVTTLAGNSSQRGNANGTGAAATFSAPVGLALDSGGNLYVADSTNHTVRKVTSSGAVTTYAGQAGLSGSANGSAARFNNPTAVAIDSAGNVFVADTNNNTIRKIAPSGDVSTFAGVAGVAGSSDGTGSASLFNQPRGLAFDNAGNLYVADTGNSTLRKIAPSGAVTTVAGLSAVSAVKDDDDDNDDPGTHPVSTALFDHPLAVAVESAGSIYLGDTGASAVRKVDAQGHVTTLTLTQVQTPPSSGGTGNTNTGSGNTGTGGTGSTSAVGGGGGGAPSPWWSLAVLAALAARRRRLGLPHR